MTGKRLQTPLPPQQVAPSASGRTVAELAQKDPRRSDREREKQQQRKQGRKQQGLDVAILHFLLLLLLVML